jgi:hypothetical protein
MNKEKVYEIGQTYIKLDFKADRGFKESFEKYLLYKGKEYSSIVYNRELLIDGLYFQVELEDGSLIARLKIFGKMVIGAFIAYGGARTTIDYLIKDSQAVTEYIARDISNEPTIGANSIVRVERRLGVPGKVKRLYNDIARLNRNRGNLTENEQQELIENIQRHYENLILELDQQEIQIIEQNLIQQQIPLPLPNQNQNGNFYFPIQYGIREDELGLISEDDIHEIRRLPPRQ